MLIIRKTPFQDQIECRHLLLTFRPIKYWKYTYWAYWGHGKNRIFALQTHYITITLKKHLGSIGFAVFMSYTKRFLEANGEWDETLGKWVFTDGYRENPPRKIFLLRLQKAGMLDEKSRLELQQIEAKENSNHDK